MFKQTFFKEDISMSTGHSTEFFIDKFNADGQKYSNSGFSWTKWRCLCLGKIGFCRSRGKSGDSFRHHLLHLWGAQKLCWRGRLTLLCVPPSSLLASTILWPSWGLLIFVFHLIFHTNTHNDDSDDGVPTDMYVYIISLNVPGLPARNVSGTFYSGTKKINFLNGFLKGSNF